MCDKKQEYIFNDRGGVVGLVCTYSNGSVSKVQVAIIAQSDQLTLATPMSVRSCWLLTHLAFSSC